MENDNIFREPPVFTNQKGETLSLSEITKDRKIVSVTIAYLSKKRREKAAGLMGFFGRKEIKQDKKEIIINDPRGITLYFTQGVESTVIRFWDKKEFEKLADGGYDESTLWKRFVMTMIRPYQINFHIGNLRKVDWQ